MAQLGRFERTVTDASGNAVSGASVTIYKQGATVSSVSSATIYVTYDAGALVNGETVQINTSSGTTCAITALTGTQVTVGASGFSGVSSGDRIVQITSKPTIYSEATGTASTSNPLTTDSNGFVSCYLACGKYDVIISGGGLTTRLIRDVPVGSGESFLSTIFDGASAVGWVLDTFRSITTAGSKLLSLRTAGSEKFSVDRQGGFTAAQASTITAGGLTITAGGLTVSAGGATVTGAITASTSISATTSVSATTTITAGTGITSTTGNIQATAGGLILMDNMAAPSATVGLAKIYVDTADGDLKIIFGDGVVKTIVVDT